MDGDLARRPQNFGVAPSTNRVEALTGARALAALYILLLHFGAPLFRHAPHWARTLRQTGFVVTSWFIMLSGFVLTIAYGRKLGEGRMDRRDFVIQRLARVYPVYLLGLLLMLPFAFVHRWGTVTSAFGDASVRYKLVTGLTQATFSHVWLPRLMNAWNVPDWCVSVEMWFYAFFPFLVVWLLRRSRGWLWLTLIATWTVALTFSIAYTVLRPDGFVADAGSVGFYINMYKYSPLTRWPEFIFGMALGALWLALPTARRGQRLATFFVGGAGLATLGVLLLGDRIPYTLLHNGTLLPLFAVLIWGLMLGEGPLHRGLACRPLTTLGDASYALYILEVPLFQWLVLLGGRRYGYGGPDAPFTAVALLAIIAAAVVLRRFYEKPAQPRLRALLERLWPVPSAEGEVTPVAAR